MIYDIIFLFQTYIMYGFRYALSHCVANVHHYTKETVVCDLTGVRF